MSARFCLGGLQFSCFAEDLGEAVCEAIEAPVLFAVNQASTPRQGPSAGWEAPQLNKSPTERKYTFSLAAINGTGQLIGSLDGYLPDSVS